MDALHKARLVLLLMAVPCVVSGSAAASGGERSPRAAQSTPGLIPVWAFVNGEAPVVGGRVRVVAGGRALRQVDGRVFERTNRQGVALLVLKRVPRRFTVIVRGGRADGRRIEGSQRRRSRSYRDAEVLDVNPLSTLTTQLQRQRPGLSARRAELKVKRYFRLPLWADIGQDFRDSGNSWFDARRYLRAAKRHGSIDRHNRVLARRVLRGPPRRTLGGAPPHALVATPPRARAAADGPTVKDMLKKVFKRLGKAVGEAALAGSIEGAFGGLISLAQAVGLVAPSEMDEVRQQLNEISRQLTRLEGQVQELSRDLARSDASRLLHLSDDVLARIDHAIEQLALLANTTQTDPTRKPFADTIDAYIGAHLLDAPARLHRQLNPALDIGDNAIKATSRALAAEGRFFGQNESRAVQAVYDYFATYQLQLAVLLTNYWNAHPETYSVPTRQASLARIETSVTTTQTQSLKPALPPNTFIDKRTPKLMWGTDNLRVNAFDVELHDMTTRATLRLAGFENFQAPSYPDLESLVNGASGTPRSWLQERVGFQLRQQLLWAYKSIQKGLTATGQGVYYRISVFDLATGKVERHEYGDPGSWTREWDCPTRAVCGWVGNDPNNHKGVLQDDRIAAYLRSKVGGLLLLRYMSPTESYWW